jgi:3-dehydroquinate dehydratase-2
MLQHARRAAIGDRHSLVRESDGHLGIRCYNCAVKPTPGQWRTGSRRHRIAPIDGPNMSNLGRRNERVYGTISSLDELHCVVGEFAETLGVQLNTFSSNYEGAILEFLHVSADDTDGYIINPAGLTTTGEATRHALEETGRPAIEVHFANITATGGAAGQGRGLPVGASESRFSRTVTGVMMGMRQYSYLAALLALTLALDDETFLAARAA